MEKDPQPRSAGPREAATRNVVEKVLASSQDLADAGAPVFAFFYDELRSVASALMRNQAAGHTLPPTALVHEAYLRIGGSKLEGPHAKARFFALAISAMRSILVDHARRKKAAKRGGSGERVPLDAVIEAFEERQLDVLLIDDAIDRLRQVDATLARIVEARYFGGLTVSETAEVLKLSTATIERGWRTARAYMRVELGG